MGWRSFWSDVDDDLNISETGQSVGEFFNDVDNDLNISETHGLSLLYSNPLTATFAYMGTRYQNAEEAADRAEAAAASANAARQASQRTVNFRNMMKTTEQNQLAAAQLMNMAAAGGIMDSSAVQQSLSSQKSQVLESGNFNQTLDTLGIAEQSALDRMRREEKEYGRNMQVGNFLLNTGMNFLTAGVGNNMGGTTVNPSG